MESNMWKGFKDEVDYWIEDLANEEDNRYLHITENDKKVIVNRVCNNPYLIQEINDIVRDEIRDHFKKITRECLDFELEDDESENGGVSFKGETLRDFLYESCIPLYTPLKEINEFLKDCGIKEIKGEQL